jgi:hypothetical protein
MPFFARPTGLLLHQELAQQKASEQLNLLAMKFVGRSRGLSPATPARYEIARATRRLWIGRHLSLIQLAGRFR